MFNEKSEGMEGSCGMEMHKKCGKEFKLAHLKMKESMLEAKLEFVREIKKLIEKSPAEKEEE